MKTNATPSLTKTRVHEYQKSVVIYRRTNETTKSHRHDKAVSPAFNRIIVKAGVPDKRGRLERLPVLLFSQPITVTNAKGSP